MFTLKVISSDRKRGQLRTAVRIHLIFLGEKGDTSMLVEEEEVVMRMQNVSGGVER
jgi:hypothetical protein